MSPDPVHEGPRQGYPLPPDQPPPTPAVKEREEESETEDEE